MCDTLVAPAGQTANHNLLFGKNSDRQRNEAQVVELLARAGHVSGSQLSCTYIVIPQVSHTHAVLVCRPFWLWGAEMGANEHSVVIGNEGLHPKGAAPEEKALTGMDLVRLALERATSAAEALETITALLSQYGQGGNCGHLVPAYYHNAFMIADPTEAYVLESVGREWLSERVRDIRALSNGYSINSGMHRISSGLSGLLRDLQWSSEVPASYADVLSNREREFIGQACVRRARAESLMHQAKGRLRIADVWTILRDHGHSAGEPLWDPEATQTHSLCMHAGPGIRIAQTTGALASEVRRGDSIHWVTGTSAPCISIFKPVLMDIPLPSHGPRPQDRFDARTLWWCHEQLHRSTLRGDFGRFLAEIRPERDALETDFHDRILSVLNGGSVRDRSIVVSTCWQEAQELEARWISRLTHPKIAGDSPYQASWCEFNHRAGIEV
jgi:secernin